MLSRYLVNFKSIKLIIVLDFASIFPVKIEKAVMILQHLQLGSPGQPCLSGVQEGWSGRTVNLGYTKAFIVLPGGFHFTSAVLCPNHQTLPSYSSMI